MQPAATIPPPPSNGIEIGALDLRFYGILIATGALLAIFLTRRRYENRGGNPEVVDGAALWALIGGFLGARLAYASTHLERFRDNPLSIFAVWEGGLAFFGGLLFGALGVAYYLRRHRLALPAFADSIAPALPLAQAIGRWGNYFNQELYGTPTDLPWGLEVEPQFRVAEYTNFATFHPTFLYESIWNLCLVGFIIYLDRKKVFLRRGSLFFVYVAGYGLGRFLVELLRTDTTFRILGLSRNNWVALGAVIGGLALLYWWEKRRTPGATGMFSEGISVGEPAEREPAAEDPAG